MQSIFEVGLIFRGFTLVNHKFRDFIPKTQKQIHEDLRSSFISAITQFCETAFMGSTLEYLESGPVLLIFTTDLIQSSDFQSDEPILAYSICDKKKNVDKQVKKVKEKLTPMLLYFIQQHNNEFFAEVSKFRSFAQKIEEYFKS